MADSMQNSRSIIRSVRPVREILVIEPVQQHHGRHAILLPPERSVRSVHRELARSRFPLRGFCLSIA